MSCNQFNYCPPPPTIPCLRLTGATGPTGPTSNPTGPAGQEYVIMDANHSTFLTASSLGVTMNELMIPSVASPHFLTLTNSTLTFIDTTTTNSSILTVSSLSLLSTGSGINITPSGMNSVGFNTLLSNPVSSIIASTVSGNIVLSNREGDIIISNMNGPFVSVKSTGIVISNALACNPILTVSSGNIIMCLPTTMPSVKGALWDNGSTISIVQ